MEQSSQQPPAAKGPSSEEMLRLLVESATDFAILSMDPEGLVTTWNPGAQHVTGWAKEEILGRTADVIFTPEDRAAGAPEAERRVASAKGRALDERWSMRKDGSRFWASGLLMPLTDPSLGFVKILRDRTEAHRAEALLRESEERFRLLATSIPQLVFLTRPDGDRTWGSPQWIDFTGLDLAESLGFGWLDAIHADDREGAQAAWVEARRRGAYYAEVRVRRARDGEYRWHQMRARPVADDHASTQQWVGTMTDIHDLRELKDRQGVIMAELQHRSRNVLAVVQAISRQTLRTSPSLEAFGPEFESRLGALGRVQSLLARVDDSNIDLRDLVAAELTAHIQGAVEEKVEVEGPSVLLPASAAQALGLALHELVTNAVKYGALAQPAGRLRVTWREERAGPRSVVLTWVEHGVAMPDGGSPKKRGYGAELITRALPYQLGAKTDLEFGPDGVRCSIIAPLPGAGTGAGRG